MKTLAVGLSVGVLGILAACTNLPKNVNQNSGLQPGETLFEAAFIKGIPEWYGDMNGELAVRFPDQSYWLIRNGRLSHQVGAGNYGLKVDSIKGKAASPKAYYVAIPKNREQDLFWQNFREVMARAAKERGLKVVDELGSADALIEFEFAQAEKEEIVTQTDLVPVTSYSVTSSQASAMGSANYFNYMGQYSGFGTSSAYAQGTSISAKTSMVPVVSSVTALKYARGLTVNGLAKRDRKTLWTVNVNSQGSTGDRRTNFAALTLGALRYFEKDSGQEFAFPVSPNDPFINYLKTGSETGLYRTPAKQWQGTTLDFCSAEAKTWKGARFGYTPLALALKLGSLDTAKALVECGHDIEVASVKSSPVLAAESGNNELFDYVISLMKSRSESTLENLRALKDKSYASKYEAKFPPPKATPKPKSN